MKLNSFDFAWEPFDVKHDNVLVDVYINDLFDYRVNLQPETHSITIPDIPLGSSVYLKVYPDNGGSIYQDDYILTDKQLIKKDLKEQKLKIKKTKRIKPVIKYINRSVIKSDNNYIYINITPAFNIQPKYLIFNFFKNKKRTDELIKIKSFEVNSTLIKYPKGETSYLTIEPFDDCGVGEKFIYKNIFEYNYI